MAYIGSASDTITGDHRGKQDQILLVKIAKGIAFCVFVCRRSYLILVWSPVIVENKNDAMVG